MCILFDAPAACPGAARGLCPRDLRQASEDRGGHLRRLWDAPAACPTAAGAARGLCPRDLR